MVADPPDFWNGHHRKPQGFHRIAASITDALMRRWTATGKFRWRNVCIFDVGGMQWL
jgi:hypothetical protein